MPFAAHELLAGLLVLLAAFAIMMSPMRARAVPGLFSECIDGFMYATSAAYMLDPAAARVAWDAQALIYVEQVLHIVKRYGAAVAYAALCDVTGTL
ncbi:MAG: hypothetical protein NTV22_06135, partial [bacterium]|nr:hypothetical protein [bacterium]